MNVSIPFRPGLADVLKDYSLRDFQAGSVAGLTVGIVALPLVMERVNRVLNPPAASFPIADHSRWLPEPDKTDTVGGVKRSSPDHPNPIPKSRVPAVGAPASGTTRKKIPRERAVPEAGAPGIVEPVGR